jgi:hypothetical protein
VGGVFIRTLARIRALVSNPIVLLAILLLGLVMLFLLLRAGPFAPGSARNTKEAPEKTIGLAINEGNMSPAGGTVFEGDQVTLLIATDRPVELRIDGLGIDEEVEPSDEPVEVSFEATMAGRFAMEDGVTDTELGVLLVQPRA